MKIAIDIRTMTGPQKGIGNYVKNLIEGIKLTENPFEYFLLCDSENTYNGYKKNPKFHSLKSLFSHENHIIGDLWEHSILPYRLKKNNVSVFHGPAFRIPLIKKRFKTVVTIHDLICFLFPEMVPWKYGLYMRRLIKKVSRGADIIITDSLKTKSDLINILKIPEEKIRVVHLAVNNNFFKPGEDDNEVKKRLNIEKKYLLFVGDLQPRKNLSLLFEAFSMLPETFQKDYQIVVAGEKKWSFNKIEESLKKYNMADKVIFPGYLFDSDILSLYKSAAMFIFPSLYEGFGLPILEAMNCGVPVIASNASSLPEIAGGAAILVDPYDPEELADAIRSLNDDPSLRYEKIAAGFQRSKYFSPKRMAGETLKIYQELL